MFEVVGGQPFFDALVERFYARVEVDPTLRPLYRREPLYGLIMTFGLALAFREGARQLFGGDMRRILPPIEGSIPLLGMTYPKYRLFLLAISSLLLLAIWLFFTRTRAGIVGRAAVQDADPFDDAYASAWYRRRVLPVHVRRALLGE